MQHTYTTHPIITTLYRSAMGLLAMVLFLVWSLVAIYYVSSNTLSFDILRWSVAVTLTCFCAGWLAKLFYGPAQQTRIRISDSDLTVFTPFKTETMEFTKITGCRISRYSLLGGTLVFFAAHKKIMISSLVENFEAMLMDIHAGLRAANKAALVADKKHVRAEKRLRVHMLQIDRLSHFWLRLTRLALYCALALGIVATRLWGLPFPLVVWCMLGGAGMVMLSFAIVNYVLARKYIEKSISALPPNGQEPENTILYAAALLTLVLILCLGVVFRFFI